MSQLNTVLERIADIQIGITVPGLPIPYVLQAEPYQPSDMNSVACPFFVNEVRGGPSNLPITAGMQYRTMVVHMMLAVQRREADIDLKYGVENTAEWVDAVYAMFAQHVRLSAPSVLLKSSTNTNPITVETVVPHRLTSGDQVIIANHLVNTAANGSWTVTVTDATHFTIPTAGNGAGVQTGTMRKLQPYDLPFIVDCEITSWDLVPYAYGSVNPEIPNFLALMFPLRVREMYVTTIAE